MVREGFCKEVMFELLSEKWVGTNQVKKIVVIVLLQINLRKNPLGANEVND